MRLTDEQVKHMVTRFLGWKLPLDFSPDAGVKFEPVPLYGGTMLRPVGTNLLTATQAEEMIRHIVEEMPDVPA